MVRALLEGRKTQTRRIVKPQPEYLQVHEHKGKRIYDGANRRWCWKQLVASDCWSIGFEQELAELCPYGKPGDRLWVRESFWQRGWFEHDDELAGAGNWFWDSPIPENISYEPRFSSKWRKRPSIHMPRWASRILLEVVSVRVERLNDINEVDAIAEGLTQTESGMWLPGVCESPVWAFRELWESINGKGSWAENPWAWVIEFRVIQP